MIFETSGVFEVVAAVRTALETHVVVQRVLVGNRRLAKAAGMFAVRYLAEVGSFLRLFFRVRPGMIFFVALF